MREAKPRALIEDKPQALNCEPHDALWSLFEQQGSKLVRVSPLELPYKHAVVLWHDELVAKGYQQCTYQRKLRPVTLHLTGKMLLSDLQGVDLYGTV